jgi:uncharacterized OsmC-like protein
VIITTNNKNTDFESCFSGNDIEAINNLNSKYHSETGGCRAYALLEASLGYCLTLTIRQYAKTNNIDLDEVIAEIKLDLSNKDNPIIEKNIKLTGNLSELDKQKLMKASESCSIYKALLKGANFKVSCN